MDTRIITLHYRKVIAANAGKQWDRLVFNDSYAEFKLQAQTTAYGTPYTSYAELIQHIPKAQQLTGLVTPAVSGYVQQLNNTMPDVIDNTGRRFVSFNQFQFEIINSDIHDETKHQIAVNFYSVPLLWHDTIGNYLLVSAGGNTPEENAPTPTHLFQLMPYLTINSLQIA